MSTIHAFTYKSHITQTIQHKLNIKPFKLANSNDTLILLT